MAAQLLRKMAGSTPIWLMKCLANLWPPYLGSGVKVLEVSSNYQYVKVCLKRTWWNSNYVGTQFGGSIYSMTDPFYMLMLINNLGKTYNVWDKAAQIEFIKPGRSRLFAEFRIDESLLENVKARTANNEKYIFDLPVEIFDSEGQLIARVVKTLYVRLKKKETEGKSPN